jgi:hypothetical protein
VEAVTFFSEVIVAFGPVEKQIDIVLPMVYSTSSVVVSLQAPTVASTTNSDSGTVVVGSKDIIGAAEDGFIELGARVVIIGEDEGAFVVDDVVGDDVVGAVVKGAKDTGASVLPPPTPLLFSFLTYSIDPCVSPHTRVKYVISSWVDESFGPAPVV